MNSSAATNAVCAPWRLLKKATFPMTGANSCACTWCAARAASSCRTTPSRTKAANTCNSPMAASPTSPSGYPKAWALPLTKPTPTTPTHVFTAMRLWAPSTIFCCRAMAWATTSRPSPRRCPRPNKARPSKACRARARGSWVFAVPTYSSGWKAPGLPSSYLSSGTFCATSSSCTLSKTGWTSRWAPRVQNCWTRATTMKTPMACWPMKTVTKKPISPQATACAPKPITAPAPPRPMVPTAAF